MDLNMATMSISRSMYRAKGGQSLYQDTKTSKSRRLIDLPPESVLVLKALRERQEADGQILGFEVVEDSPVFRYRNGNPILPRAFRKIMLKAGMKGYRLHDARHAHASVMLRQGISHKVVQERLGHARVGTTLDIYSHVSPGMQKAAALRFQEAMAEARTPAP